MIAAIADSILASNLTNPLSASVTTKMSLASHTVSAIGGQRIPYSKANEFLKLVDQEQSARELSKVLLPGTYYIGFGDGIIQWNGQIAYHAPPNGDMEIYDCLKMSKNNAASRSTHSSKVHSGRNAIGGLLHEVAELQNRCRSSSQGFGTDTQRDQPDEMESPWSRGWAEAERQERH